MAWQLYRVTYELQSPLHIGYHKISNVQRTRYYVPARNIWGAVTERLTRSGFTVSGVPEGDYVKIGKWVKTHCLFSYLFLEGDELLFPRYATDGVRYGSLKQSEFERRYLSAHVTTALDATTTSAEVGSLHEIEILTTYVENGGRHARLMGWVFLDGTAFAVLGEEGKWRQWLGEFQVGGERRYGFGRFRMTQGGWQAEEANQIFDGYGVRCDRDWPQIEVTEGEALLAHTLTQGVSASGAIEPLVGRQTTGSDRFGGKLTSAELCWVPGSISETTLWFEFAPEGIWKRTVA